MASSGPLVAAPGSPVASCGPLLSAPGSPTALPVLQRSCVVRQWRPLVSRLAPITRLVSAPGSPVAAPSLSAVVSVRAVSLAVMAGSHAHFPPKRLRKGQRVFISD